MMPVLSYCFDYQFAPKKNALIKSNSYAFM